MNLILKRFKNELIIALALIFAIYAFSYKISAKSFVEEKQSGIGSTIGEISRIVELKKLWSSKQISKDASGLRNIVSKKRVKSFKKTSEKVTVKYTGLNIKELNKITRKIMNRAFQIKKLEIIKTGTQNYSMELICKW
jgi:hypothetical protein